MPVANLVLDAPTKDFESYYIKVTDGASNLVVYSASLDKSKKLLRCVGELPGLYILQAEDSTVYVGQSKTLKSRLNNHRSTRKIGFVRILAFVRDQGLAQYLDYAEAKIYDELNKRGFHLDQTSLSSSLDAKRKRLSAQDDEHVQTADDHVMRFLTYAVVLGLTRPAIAALPAPQNPDLSQVPASLREKATLEAAPDLIKAPEAPSAPEIRKKRRSVKLVVNDSDGKEFPGADSAGVFVSALQRLGLERIERLGVEVDGEPLVSRKKHKKYPASTRQVNGFWISTHSSNAKKGSLLKRIAYQLGVSLTVA